MLTIADSYDAMTSERPYRPSMTARNAANELTGNAGRQFDAALARLFCEKVAPPK
jgi:HD-GYP domain-containing protein (c-di-GMP phosphodiesterase class II)